MRQALDCAARGFPHALPNPLVGCVITHNGKVVATGYHQKYGGHHAEVNAIKALPEQFKPAECVLYVTLEPCCHHGKTPPCTDLIISKGFKKIVVGAADPNPKVAGQGIQKLRSAGIEVITGLLAEEVKRQNARFFTFHEQKRPYYILKWAQTADGFISRWPVPISRADNHISGPEANNYTHQLRAEVMAVMVGKNTALADNPYLTVRHVHGNNPIRLIVDKSLETPRHLNIYKPDAPTIILNALHQEEEGEFLRFVKVNFEGGFLTHINDTLYNLGIQSVLVEGGAILLESMLKKGLWDEVIRIENPQLFFKNGIKAPVFEGKGQPEWLGRDKITRFYNIQA
jgi:diaminohydroxyphosphoribosylaminopyrimidine deaminase/5-amino-6-(5-phosphoribosylamino)uracil reductase